MKQAARQLAARGAKVEAAPVIEPSQDRPGRMKLTGLELFIDDESQGIAPIQSKATEVEYVENFVLMVEKLTISPEGNDESKTGMTVLKRGKISQATKIEIREMYENGATIDELVTKYSRSRASIEKVLSTSLV